MTVTEPGQYKLTEAEYHADPCPSASLSSTVGKLLLYRSPLHAWTAHPRLNPEFAPENKPAFDIGRAAHALLVGEPIDIAVVEADDWRGKDARAARDAAWAAGRTPLLLDQYTRVAAMVDTTREQLARHRCSDAFCRAAGDCEVSLIDLVVRGVDGDAWLRGRLDWLSKDKSVLYDYKTTAVAAHPDAWGARTLWDLGVDFQMAFYRRLVRDLFGVDPLCRLVVQEVSPPHGLIVIELTPSAMAQAERNVERTISIWRRCLADDCWPGYPTDVCVVDAPAWRAAKDAAREAREPTPASTLAAAAAWQAPLEDPR